MSDRYVGVRELLRELRLPISRHVILRLAREGQIPHLRLSRKTVLFNPVQVEAHFRRSFAIGVQEVGVA